jgi:hypothetical protein
MELKSEFRYFLCSFDSVNELEKLVRAHWMVETAHYKLDYHMHDNDSRCTGDTALGFQLIRKLAVLIAEYAKEVDIFGKNCKSIEDVFIFLSSYDVKAMINKLLSILDFDAYTSSSRPGEHMSESLTKIFDEMKEENLFFKIASQPATDLASAVAKHRKGEASQKPES